MGGPGRLLLSTIFSFFIICSLFVEITLRLKDLDLGNYVTNRYLRIQQSNIVLLNEVYNSGMGGHWSCWVESNRIDR